MKRLLLLALVLLSAASLPAAEKAELKADDISIIYDGARPREAYLEGSVSLVCGGVEITGGKGRVDYRANEAVLWDGPEIKSPDISGKGQQVIYDLKTGSLRAEEQALSLQPAVSAGIIDSPLYIKTKELDREKASYKARSASVTGCDRDKPHYDLKCSELTVYPSEKLVLKNAKFFWHGKKLASLSYVEIPLDERYNDPRAVPRSGYSDTEGWFGKFAYPYNPKNDRMYGLLLFDVMSKKGIGLGIKQDYGSVSGNIKGQAGYYHIINAFGEGNFRTFNFKHSQKSGRLNFIASADGRNTSYRGRDDVERYSFGAKLGYRAGATDALFDWSGLVSDTGFRTRSDLYTLSLKQRLSASTKFSGALSYSDFRYSDYRRKLLTTKMALEGSGRTADWSLGALLYDELAGEGYTGTEKKPELVISSDTSRLGLWQDKGFRVKLTAGYSRLALPDRTRVDRSLFEMEIPDYRMDLSKSSYISASAKYRQLYYASDMAKYSLGGNIYYNLTAGPNRWRLDYRYQEPHGYSPVSSDYISSYNYVNLRWLYDLKPWSAEVFGGYDFTGKTKNWHDLNARVRYFPGDSFSAYLASGYDIDAGRFKTMIGQVSMAGKSSSLSIGARYNAVSGRLTSGRLLADLGLLKDLRLRAYLNYDGYDKEIDYIVGELTAARHCYDVSLVYKKQTGSYADDSIMLCVKLNIFPDTDEFAAGLNGTGVGTGVGNLYF